MPRVGNVSAGLQLPVNSRKSEQPLGGPTPPRLSSAQVNLGVAAACAQVRVDPVQLRGRRKIASAIIVDAIGSRVDRIVAVLGPRLRVDAGSVNRSAANVDLLAVVIETVLQIDGHHLANGHEAEQSIIGHLRLTDWTTEAWMQRLPPTDSTTAALTTQVASIQESRCARRLPG
jgi:hypothetical protein